MYPLSARDSINNILSDGSRRSVTEMFELTRAQGMTISAYQSGIVYAEDAGEVTPVCERDNSVIYALTALIKTDELVAIRAAEKETSDALMAIIKSQGASTKAQLKSISNKSAFKIKSAIKYLIRSKQIYSYIDLEKGRCYQLSSVTRENSVLRKSAKPRGCIRCEKEFLSSWCGNRICPDCKKTNREYAGGFAEQLSLG